MMRDFRKKTSLGMIVLAALLSCSISTFSCSAQEMQKTQETQEMQEQTDERVNPMHAGEDEDIFKNVKPPELGIHPDFAQLYEENEDIAGWLWNGNDLDHPVMQYDNDFYLHHDYYGQDSQDGTLFVNPWCNLWPRDWMVIIHGHHMRSGAMFGRLMNYEDYAYVCQYPLIVFRTVADEEDVYYAPVAAFNASMVETDPSYFFVMEPVLFEEEAKAQLDEEAESEDPAEAGAETEQQNADFSADNEAYASISAPADNEANDLVNSPENDPVNELTDEETVKIWSEELTDDEKVKIQVDALKDDYLERILALSIWESPLDVTWEDELLMLSTCSYYQEDGRFMLVLRKLREDETPESIAELFSAAQYP